LPKKIKEKYMFIFDKNRFIEVVKEIFNYSDDEEIILEEELFDFFFYNFSDKEYGDISTLYKNSQLPLLIQLLDKFNIEYNYKIQRCEGDGIWEIECDIPEELDCIMDWADRNRLDYNADEKHVYLNDMDEEQSCDFLFLTITCDDAEKMDHIDCKRIGETNKYVVFNVIDNSTGVVYNRDLEDYSIPGAVGAFMDGYNIVTLSTKPVLYYFFSQIKRQLIKKISPTREVVF